jgi:hypothetical protein
MNPGPLQTWSKSNPTIIRLSLLAGTCVVMLLLAEIVLRLSFAEQLFLDERFTSPNVLVQHDYIPNVRYRRTPANGDTFPPVLVQINSFGIRGPLPGPKKCYRVLNVGDSFVQANQVAFEDTFGERLNRRFAGRIEFISHGMSSWSPTPEFSWIYHKGMQLKPDEVNLFLYANDFFRASVYQWADEAYRQQAVYEGKVPVRYRLEEHAVLEKARRGLAITRLLVLARRGASRIFRRNPSQNDQSPDFGLMYEPIGREFALLGQPRNAWPADLRATIDETIQVVRDLNAYLQQQHVRLNVLFVPSGWGWTNECVAAKPLYGWPANIVMPQTGLEQYLHESIRLSDIPWLDLRERLESEKKKDPTRLLFNEFDSHWNTNGHQVVFEQLNAYYEQRFPR